MTDFRTSTRSIPVFSHQLFYTCAPSFRSVSMHMSSTGRVVMYWSSTGRVVMYWDTVLCRRAIYISTSSNPASLVAWPRGGGTPIYHGLIYKVSSPQADRQTCGGIPPAPCQWKGSPPTYLIQISRRIGQPPYRIGPAYARTPPPVPKLLTAKPISSWIYLISPPLPATHHLWPWVCDPVT